MLACPILWNGIERVSYAAIKHMPDTIRKLTNNPDLTKKRVSSFWIVNIFRRRRPLNPRCRRFSGSVGCIGELAGVSLGLNFYLDDIDSVYKKLQSAQTPVNDEITLFTIFQLLQSKTWSVRTSLKYQACSLYQRRIAFIVLIYYTRISSKRITTLFRCAYSGESDQWFRSYLITLNS